MAEKKDAFGSSAKAVKETKLEAPVLKFYLMAAQVQQHILTFLNFHDALNMAISGQFTGALLPTEDRSKGIRDRILFLFNLYKEFLINSEAEAKEAFKLFEWMD